MRRAFDLLAVDREFLDSRGKPWETLVESSQWVLIEEFELPAGYNHSVVSVALRLPASYPDVQIDMAYFFPALARADGKTINRLTPQPLDGKTWQQWSRHRVGEDAWRAGTDNVETHLLYVTAWLEAELQH